MIEKLAMGGYGPYVWTCFALAAIVVIGAEWAGRVRHKRVYRDIEVRIKALEDRQ
jgi:heme exporter protein CcmD